VGQEGPVRPEPGEVVEGSLDELTEMDCVIELDDQADGTVEQRWGIDYFGDQIERKLIWEQDEDVTVVYFDEDERPWLACWPGRCDLMTEPEEQGSSGCDVSVAPVFRLRVEDYDNPPDQPLGSAVEVWLGPGGVPLGIHYYESAGNYADECFFPDGTLSYVRDAFDYGYRSWEFFPNQQLAEYVMHDDGGDFFYFSKEAVFCASTGWELSATDYYDTYYGRWSTTTYDNLGGAPGVGESVAHTVLESMAGDYFDRAIADSDIVSVINESDDGLTFEVTASSQLAGWTDTFAVDRMVARPHVVDRTFDASGRLRSEQVDISADGIADYNRAYSYSGGCLGGESPQLDFLPHSEGPNDLPSSQCTFSPLPEDVWRHYP
jgi:hypothetical protein